MSQIVEIDEKEIKQKQLSAIRGYLSKDGIFFLIKNNFRQVVLIILLFLLLLNGKNITDPDNKSNKDYENTYYSSITEIGPYSKETVIDSINFDKGNSYRLLLLLDSIPVGQEELKDYSPEEVSLSIAANDKQEQSIGPLQFEKNQNISKEIIFNSEINSNRLTIKRTKYSNSILKVRRISINSLSSTHSLRTSLINNVDYDKISSSYLPPNPTIIAGIDNKKIITGQIFKPKFAFIDGASFKINFLGNGGAYSHTIELREAVPNNNSYTLKDTKISAFKFTTDFAKSHLKEPEAEDIYRFPLNAKLDPNKYYFIGFDNTAITNGFNQIQLYGTKNNENAYTFTKNGKNAELLGGFYHKIYGDNLPDENLPNGTIIQDLGNNYGELSYESKYDIFHNNVIYEDELTQVYKYSLWEYLLNAEVKFDNYNPNISYYYSTNGISWVQIYPYLDTKNTLFLNNLNGSKEIYFKFVKNDKDINNPNILQLKLGLSFYE